MISVCLKLYEGGISQNLHIGRKNMYSNLVYLLDFLCAPCTKILPISWILNLFSKFRVLREAEITYYPPYLDKNRNRILHTQYTIDIPNTLVFATYMQVLRIPPSYTKDSNPQKRYTKGYIWYVKYIPIYCYVVRIGPGSEITVLW